MLSAIHLAFHKTMILVLNEVFIHQGQLKLNYFHSQQMSMWISGLTVRPLTPHYLTSAPHKSTISR